MLPLCPSRWPIAFVSDIGPRLLELPDHAKQERIKPLLYLDVLT